MKTCYDCAYCGDKFSFPDSENFADVFADNEKMKHFYCCCGDCVNYRKEVFDNTAMNCNCFEGV